MRLRPFLLLLLLPALAACDESVAPTFNTGAPFTLYGRFDPRADTQAIRVVPIDDVLRPTDAAPLGATVTSTNLRTGEQMAWRDTVVTFEDGTVGHVFTAPFRAEYDAAYRIEAVAANGARTSATTAVPPFVEPLAQYPKSRITGTHLPVLWPAAPRLNAVEVTYNIQTSDCRTLHVTLPVLPEDTQMFEFGWITEARISQDRQTVLDQLNIGRAVLASLTFTALVSNEGWTPPGGVFDPELLVEPTAFTNVENGFGFVGGGYPIHFETEPPALAARQAGWESKGAFGC